MAGEPLLPEILRKWITGLRLGKSSGIANIGPDHFLELLIRIKKWPALLLQKKTDASTESTCAVVVDHVEGLFAEAITFNRDGILEDGWNDAKAKLALAILFVSIYKIRLANNGILDAVQALPDEQQRVIEKALQALNDTGPTDESFTRSLEFVGAGSFLSPDSSRGTKRKSVSSFGNCSPTSSTGDSPHPRAISAMKRRNAKITSLEGEVRMMRAENEELRQKFDELLSEKMESEARVRTLETNCKSLKTDNANLEALLIQASGDGGKESEERLERLLRQLRQTKDDLKFETEGRALAESRELALRDQLEKLQTRFDKVCTARDAAVTAVEEAQSTIDSSIAAEVELRVRNDSLVEELNKLRDELRLYEDDATRFTPKRPRRSFDLETPSEDEGENLMCVLEAQRDDLRQELDSARKEVEQYKFEKAELTVKYESQLKSASEKARFIGTLTNETKRLKTEMVNQRNMYNDRIANLEMRLAKATKDKNMETLALQDLRETCDEQLTKIKNLEKELCEKLKELQELSGKSQDTSELEKLRTENATLSAQVQEVKSTVVVKDAELETFRSELDKIRQSLIECDEVRQQLASELKDANDGFAQAQTQLCDVRGRLAHIEEQNAEDKREAQRKLEELHRKFEEKSNCADQVACRLEEADEARKQLLSELQDTELAYASFQEKFNDIRSRHNKEREEMQKSTSEMKESLSKSASQLAARDAEIQRLSDQVNSLEAALVEKTSLLEESAARVKNLVEERETLKKSNEETCVAVDSRVKALEESVKHSRESSADEVLNIQYALEQVKLKLTETESQLQVASREKADLMCQLEAASRALDQERSESIQKLDDLRALLSDKSKSLEAVQDRVEQLTTVVDRSQSELNLAKSRETAMNEERLKLLQDNTDLRVQMRKTKEVLQAEREQWQKERGQFVKTNYEAHKKLDEAKRQVEAQLVTKEEVIVKQENDAMMETESGELRDLKIEVTQALASKLALENKVLDMEMRIESLENEKCELEETLANIERNLEAYHKKEEEVEREKEKLQAELHEVRVQLTNVQVVLQTAQSDRNRQEQEREELVKANYELRQQLDEERQESSNLRSNLEAENSGLAEQVRSLETSRAELLEELDRSNMNMSLVSPELEELRTKARTLQVTHEKTKQAMFQFATKFQMPLTKEQCDLPNFTVDFCGKISKVVDSVHGDAAAFDQKMLQLRNENKQLKKDLAEMESKKDAEILEIKQFTKNHMREVTDTVAKDEERYERRLREKDEKLSRALKDRDEVIEKYARALKERDEVIEKYARAKRKLEEFSEKYSGVARTHEALAKLTEENTLLKRDNAERLLAITKLEKRLGTLSTEKATLEANLKFVDLDLREKNKRLINISSFEEPRKSENFYETIPGATDEEDGPLPGMGRRNSNFSHIYANLPQRRATSSASLATMLCRTVSTTSVAPLACEDEPGEILSATMLSGNGQKKDERNPEFDPQGRIFELQRRNTLYPTQLRSSYGTENFGPSANSTELDTKDVSITHLFTSKKPCTKLHRRSRSLSPCFDLGRRPLHGFDGNLSRDTTLDSSCASTSSEASTGSRRFKKNASQTLYNKPGPPTPGRNCSNDRMRARKSLQKKKVSAVGTPGSLKGFLRNSLLSSTIDKENVSVVGNASVVSSSKDSPATRTRSKVKTNVFRNPFRGH